MQAVYFLEDRAIEMREVADPEPREDEVVLEIKASGMCGSDLKFYRTVGGAAALGLGGDGEPVIGGHEPCGVVVEVGSGVSSQVATVGMRAMNHHYSGCGFCLHCSAGWSQMCDHGAVVYGATGNGAHAKYMSVPAHTLVPLPDSLSYKTGAAISWGAGTAFGALDRLQLRGTDTLAVFGQGPVGLSTTHLAKALGARVIALDVSQERLDRARDFGADELLDASRDDVVTALYDLTHGVGVDCAIDCSSASAARSQAIKATRKWGRVAFVGEGGDVTIDVSSDMLRKQLTILGSWTFSKQGQADCSRFVESRGVDVDALFTDEWPLAEAVEAYKQFDQQTMGKGLLIS